jgi:predicted O-linked N-acetylglucosamine transferase (SPINDLY family)
LTSVGGTANPIESKTPLKIPDSRSGDPITTEELFEQSLAHHQAGRVADAARVYQEILVRKPRDVDAMYLLGIIAHQTGNHEEAIQRMERALEIVPDQEHCCNVLGLALMALGRVGEAEASLRRAIAFNSRSVVAHTNLCVLLKSQDRVREALPFYERAVDLDPRNAELHREYGDALQTLGQFQLASTAYAKALEIDPGLTRAWYAAGCAENARREYVSACGCFEKALAQSPDWSQAMHNFGQALYRLGQTDRSIDLFQQAARAPAPQLSLSAIASIIPASPSATNQSILEARQAFGRTLTPRRALAPRAKNDRLRVGYVSSFFADHNWMKPVWGLISHHDHEQFDIHLFSDGPQLAIQYAYHGRETFHDISALSNEEAASLIDRTGIDLLIDLNGYSAMRRLPLIALHPAPVVAAWFNMFAASGMDGYDYLIGDETVLPLLEEQFYTEKIVRVEGSYLTFEVNYPVPEVSPAPYLSNGFITFGCLAPLYKINAGVIAAWNRVLEQVRDSRLLLKNAQLGSLNNRIYVQKLFIDPNRVLLEGPAAHFEYLETYRRIDVALDTFPYNGGTTTSEAIWQGVPVLTFTGDRWVSRTSASILRAAGLEDFVAPDLEGYISQAVSISSKPLSDLRSSMRSRLRTSSACNTRAFAGHMERLYRRLVGMNPE